MQTLPQSSYENGYGEQKIIHHLWAGYWAATMFNIPLSPSLKRDERSTK
jgi:hypothetical protein